MKDEQIDVQLTNEELDELLRDLPRSLRELDGDDGRRELGNG